MVQAFMGLTTCLLSLYAMQLALLSIEVCLTSTEMVWMHIYVHNYYGDFVVAISKICLSFEYSFIMLYYYSGCINSVENVMCKNVKFPIVLKSDSEKF